MAANITPIEMEEILERAIDTLYIPHFEKLGMNASGQWKNKVEARGTEIWGMDYTEFLAKGRGANHDQSPEALKAWVGKAARSWVPQWLKDKGLTHLNPYAVAQNIARKGTTWKEKGGSDIVEFLNSKEFLDFIRREVAEKLNEKVQEDLFILTKLAFQR